MVWSDDNKLAVLYEENLYLFSSSSLGDVYESIFGWQPINPVGPYYPLDVGITSAEKINFWTNDLLLLWGRDSIWKLDLKKALAQKE